MDPSRRRAWAALGLGPAWVMRTPQAGDTADACGASADVAPALRADVVPAPHAEPAGVPRHAASERPDAPAPVVDRRDASRADVLASERSPADAIAPDASPAQAASFDASPAEAVAFEVSRADWGALRTAVEGCRACGLCETRTRTVFGVGPETARWMLIGEAPGADEDARGEPFVGRAGQLLDNMLSSIGLDRRRNVFIANVLKCRPPRNRDPLPEEIAQCTPYLLRQIELLSPDVIVVTGRFSAATLLQSQEGIGRLRGRVHACRVGDREVPVIVTYHPAYLLRRPEEKAKAWADLCLARSVLAR